MPTPFTRSELLDLIDAFITDPLNRQNTAARVRDVLKALAQSSANLLDDGARGSGNPDLTALLAKINSKQDKAAPVAQDAYGPGRPAAPLTTVLEQLEYLFQNSTAASLTYTIDEAKDKRDNNALPNNGRPTVAIPDVWNGSGDSVVYLQVFEANRWAKYGELVDAQGNRSWVEVDLDAATAVAYGGGGSMTTRDPYDVPTAKRKEVVDANVAAYPETDQAFYGCEFVDEVYGPGKPTSYKCLPSAPATTGGATVWKWFRFDIL